MTARPDTARCLTLPEFEAHDGERVLVVGAYRAIAVRQRARPDAEADHACVRLHDGSEILLEPNWSEAARRSREERSRFDARQVEVDGVAHAKSPRPPQPIAYVIGPCLSPVFSVRTTEETNGS
jgi:hypothetical protein